MVNTVCDQIHPRTMDQWIQKLALAILLVVVTLCLYGTNREIHCQTPAHFTSDQSRHVHQACTKPDADTFPVIPNTIPREFEESITRYLWTSHIDTKSAWLLKLVLVEVIVICTSYCLIDWIVAAGCFDAQSPHKELHQSYFKVPLYFLIQLVCGICWVAFTIVSNQESEFPTSQTSFMCNFKVRRMGRIQRYTIQCVDDHDHLTRAAFMINFGLALVVTLTKLIHVVSALLIGPLLGLKAARAALMQSGVIQNPGELGVGFALSDLYFAMLVGGKRSPDRSNVDFGGSNEAQGRRSKDTELSLLVGSG